MNHPKADLKDILGTRPPCYFSSKGERPFKYSDNCRDCIEKKNYYRCDSYIPSRQTKHYDTLTAKDVAIRDKTAYTHSQGENISNSKFYSSPLDTIQRNETQIAKNARILRPFYWYHTTINHLMKPKVSHGIIRTINDQFTI